MDWPAEVVLIRPDYAASGIANLMASLGEGLGRGLPGYPSLGMLDPETIRACRNVVVLVIDGLGYDYLSEAGRGGALHASLRGAMTSVFPSTTACAVTTLLTGVPPQQHGLTGWYVYFRELGATTTPLPFRTRFGADIAAAGIEPHRLFTTPSFFTGLAADGYMLIPGHLADTAYTRAHAGDAECVPYNSLASFQRAIEETVRRDGRRKYVHAYWPQLDALAHAHGIASDAVAQHFHELDALFAHLCARLAGTGTLLIATADHGFTDVGRAGLVDIQDHPELQETLAMPLAGDKRVAYCYVRSGAADAFQAYVREHLDHAAELWRSEELIAAGLFGTGEPHPRLHERVGDYALVFRHGFAVRDVVLGERGAIQIGVHSGVSREEMLVPLSVETLA